MCKCFWQVSENNSDMVKTPFTLVNELFIHFAKQVSNSY
jgi:hypothetical protein